MIDFSLSKALADDPKRLAFTAARYKFVARMFHGFKDVLEVGAADGLMSKVVAQSVGRVECIDLNPCGPGVIQHDLCEIPYPCWWDGIYALDVLEHIPPEKEDAFLDNLCTSLGPYGTCIIGMPSQESQVYASENSRADHVNCKTEDDLRATMARHFYHVYLFGMNDETLHTGFGPMTHYRLALCSRKR